MSDIRDNTARRLFAHAIPLRIVAAEADCLAFEHTGVIIEGFNIRIYDTRTAEVVVKDKETGEPAVLAEGGAA